ncbi:hypothetical protein FRC02_003754 [Tulasnella sp. 418]|nr:hypothetical protein FRC02_003754 [Tulasnella sp. 418]
MKKLRPILEREKNRGDRDPSSVHYNPPPDEDDPVEEEEAVEEDEVMGGTRDAIDDDEEMDEDEEPRGQRRDEPDLDLDEEQLLNADTTAEEEMDNISEFDEEDTLYTKDPQEIAQIVAEIEDLEKNVPGLKEDYRLVDRLGEGTFSSVYKAVDLHHHAKWYNATWLGYHPPTSSAHFQSVPYAESSKVFVAIKRIYVTSSPTRISNEIELMELCRGCRHVAQLITAFRYKDQVVAIMPYHRNVDFRKYFMTLPLSGIQSYFRCLLRALRDIHAREIVHRDVKPANFLFDPETQQGVLVDFGLAQQVDYDVETTCNHTSASKHHPHGTLKSLSKEEVAKIKQVVAEARKKSQGPSERVGWPSEDTRQHIKANRAGTRGFRAPEVLLKCEDQTVALDIWSAGTIMLSFLCCKFPIFNANDDIEALMEIASIIGKRKMEKCAQLHNRTFCTNVPSVDHPGIPWQEVIERLNPSILEPSPPVSPSRRNSLASDSSSSPTVDPGYAPPGYNRGSDPLLTHAYDLLDKMMHPDMTKRITARDALFHPFLAEYIDPPEDDQDEGNIDLMEGQLETREYTDPDTGEVITASGDDLYVPHPFGDGVCKQGHWIDEDTREHCVFVVIDRIPPSEMSDETEEERVMRRQKEEEAGIIEIRETDELWHASGSSEDGTGGGAAILKVAVKRLDAGEGIAIGLNPCEYHRKGIVDKVYWEMHFGAENRYWGASYDADENAEAVHELDIGDDGTVHQ